MSAAAPVLRPIPVEQSRPLRQAILRPHLTIEEMAGSEPPDAVAVGAFAGDELVAVGLAGPQGAPGAWRVRGMATVPRARGRGAGTAVLKALLDHATTHGASRVWASVRTPARSLYERAGFRVISEEFELPDIGPHVLMELEMPASSPGRQRPPTTRPAAAREGSR